MRVRKPWFRASKNAWYVELDGKQVRLAVGKENEETAFDAFYKLMAGGPRQPSDDGLLVVTLCDLFLEFSLLHHAKKSYRLYKDFLQSFCKLHGRLLASQLKPFHLTRWVDQRTSWKAAKRHAVVAVKRAFSWAEQEGLIASNPIKHVKKPPCNRRERVVTADERRQILGAIKDQPFRDFVFAMQETGCRPGEIATVTAADCNFTLGIWVLKQHKTAGKTGRPRIIYLTPVALELSRRLAEQHSVGPIFRNTRGRPFSGNAIRCRFRELRRKHSNLAGVVAYSYRHSFATDALIKGVGVAQVAELLGHTNTNMVMRHYSHLADNVAHLRQAALRATQTEENAAARE
jgi:integrase